MTVELASLRKIAEGREAEIFAWQEPGKVLRLLRGSDDVSRLETEALAMRAAREAGLPVPEPLGVTTVDGRAGLIMARIDGPDLLTKIGNRPWTLLRAARITGELHARLHAVPAPAATPSLHDAIPRRLSRVPLRDDLRAFVLELLARLPDGDAVCHGDLHPGNIIDTRSGPVIIDWPNVTRGHPDADLARTRLMLRMGEPPPGSPLVVRYFVGIARGVFRNRYEAAYRRLRRPDDATLATWEIVRAADRLADGIESERARLIDIVQSAYDRSRA